MIKYLVGGNEVGEVDGGQRLHGRHLLVELVLQAHIQHLGAAHRIAQGQLVFVRVRLCLIGRV